MGQLDRENIPPQLKAALQSYLTAEDKPTPVSIGAAMRAMREALPGLELTDDELAAMIAREVVTSGASVVFDSRPTK